MEHSEGESMCCMPLICRNEKVTIDVVKLLVEKGASLNYYDKTGWTALHHICRNSVADNKFEILKFLVDKGADLNEWTDKP